MDIAVARILFATFSGIGSLETRCILFPRLIFTLNESQPSLMPLFLANSILKWGCISFGTRLKTTHVRSQTFREGCPNFFLREGDAKNLLREGEKLFHLGRG